jgi:hypothetical protein
MENETVFGGVVLASSTVLVCRPAKLENASIANLVKSKNFDVPVLQWSAEYKKFVTYPNLIPENFQAVPAEVSVNGLYEWKFRDPTDRVHTVIASDLMYTIVNGQFTQLKYISSAAVITDGEGRLCKLISKTAYIPKTDDIFYFVRMQDMTGIVINGLILGA